MPSKRLILSMMVVSVIASPSGRQETKSTRSEQMQFALEAPVTRPAALPEPVLVILARDPIVAASRCVEVQEASGQVSASWFEASNIHLDGSSELDVVVKAKNGCLFGANIGPFWIFRKTSQRYEAVLSVSALGIRILKARSSDGYRDIRAEAVAGDKVTSVTYRFDGKKYQPYATNTAARR